MTLDTTTYAERINAAHRAGNEAAMTALEHYREAGELLNEVKAGLPHGGFAPWLEANFEGSERTARNYMRLAENWPAIEAKRQRVADLSLRGALAELAAPKTKGLVAHIASYLPSYGELLFCMFADGGSLVTGFIFECPDKDGAYVVGRCVERNEEAYVEGWPRGLYAPLVATGLVKLGLPPIESDEWLWQQETEWGQGDEWPCGYARGVYDLLRKGYREPTYKSAQHQTSRRRDIS